MHDGAPDLISGLDENKTFATGMKRAIKESSSVTKHKLITDFDKKKGFTCVAEVVVHEQGFFMTQSIETGALMIAGDIENIACFTGMFSIDLQPIFELAGKGKFEIELNGFIFKSL